MKSQVTITLTKDLSDDQIKKMEELLSSPNLLEATTQAYEKAVSQLFGEEGVKTEVQIDLLRGDETDESINQKRRTMEH